MPTKRGRPLDERVDARIVAATLELIAERGVGAAAMDEIAARSGVSKPTIYHRWPSKDALLLAAVEQHPQPQALRQTHDPRRDCVQILRSLDEARGIDPRLFPRIVAEFSANEPLARLFQKRVLQPQRDACADAVKRGVAARQLAADTNIQAAVDLLIGPILYRRLIAPATRASGVLPAQVVDAVWSAYAPRT